MQDKRWDVPKKTRPAMVHTAKHLRKTPTPSQDRFWQAVRRKSLGVRFRREQPIGPFIVDFLVASKRLVIEIDGSIHDCKEVADLERQRNLESLGFQFLRFRASDVMDDLPNVIHKVRHVLANRA